MVSDITEDQRIGISYLETVTELLQRVRNAHPTKGLFEAADMQWWWRDPRSTDEIPQLFWIDDGGHPIAAIIATDWGSGVALDPMFMPDADPEFVAQVVERGLAHIDEFGLDAPEILVDRADIVLSEVLAGHGFVSEANDKDDVEAWLDADALPEASELGEGYHLRSRLETSGRPHHMISEERNHKDPEQRLQQTSLYRSDLDLAVFDEEGNVGGYGLFWLDPTTGIGMVEPMRTEDAHQRKGIARHVLTTGVNRLARAGAERIKIAFNPTNAAASSLYTDVGFVPVKENCVFAR